MRPSLSNNLLIAVLVLVIVFTISIVLTFRDPIVPSLIAGIDYLGVILGLREDSDDIGNAGGTSHLSKEIRARLKKMRVEKSLLRNSKRRLKADINVLEEEIDTLRLDVQIFKEIVIEIKMENEITKIKEELIAEMEAERQLRDEEEELIEEPESEEELESESEIFDEDQIYREAVNFYVDWLRDNRAYASRNQKAYLCSNQNVAQFSSVSDSDAFREACGVAGYQETRTRLDFTGNQKSFLCRNQSVARFLARNPNISISEACGN